MNYLDLTIEEIHDKVLERLAFTLLCLAKFRNFRNPNNNNWVNYSNGEIYSMACINTTAFEKDVKFNKLKELGGECVECPIAICGDIEIIFMHYKTPEEALKKWTRRVERMNWNNLIIKFSEMNGCTEDDLKAFDSLPYQKKVAFVTRDYGLKSQAIFKQFLGKEKIDNDTDNFRKYINLYDLIIGKFNK